MSAVLKEALRDAAGATAERAQSAACFHCGLPVPHDSAWQATIGGNVERMCCPGCAAAAQAIVDGGFADYYATRSAYAAQADLEAANAPELDLVDDGDVGGSASFTVEGIRCAACVWLIERRLQNLPGVLDVSLNVATELLDYIAMSVAALAVVLDCGEVILTGALPERAGVLVDEIDRRLTGRIPAPPRILIGELGERAAVVGIGQLAIDRVNGALYLA